MLVITSMRQDLQRKVLTRGLHHEIDDPEGQEDDNQYPPEFDSPFFCDYPSIPYLIKTIRHCRFRHVYRCGGSVCGIVREPRIRKAPGHLRTKSLEFRENIFLFKKSGAENLRKKDRRIRAGYSN